MPGNTSTSTVPPNTSPQQDLCNIAGYLPRMADERPTQPAVVLANPATATRGQPAQWTFAELEAQSNRFANGLTAAGVTRGMRVLVMVRPGLEFIGLIFALFKMGVVPVLIDPGMGPRRLLACVRQARPEAFVGIPLAQAVRVLRPRPFHTVRRAITVGRRWFWGGWALSALVRNAPAEFAPAATYAQETAAILFTSGSTGPAKGVVYEHGMFDAQVHAIRDAYGIEPGEIDLPAFPLFALFSTAMGMTCIIPDMDPSRPARVDPAKIVEAVQRCGVTTTFGSPAIWRRVAAYCHANGLTLPSLRRVLIAGAPVPTALIEQMRGALTGSADVHTPYGATESLPVASISGREVLEECAAKTRRGAGICVGRPLKGVTLRIIRITDEPVAAWPEALVLPPEEIGEIAVKGDIVTRCYDGLPEATAAAKIRDGEHFWHRIGDVGYLDEYGRLWFCGRKAHRVVTEHGTMFTVPCEAIFNEHPDVYRSALVGVGSRGRQRPVLVVEPEPGRWPRRRRAAAWAEELRALAQGHEHTRPIEQFQFRRRFPVDVRHNAKIDREQLADWAAGRRR